MGHGFIHVVLDHSRIPYAEIHHDDGVTAAGALRSVGAWFAARGVSDRAGPPRVRVALSAPADARRVAPRCSRCGREGAHFGQS